MSQYTPRAVMRVSLCSLTVLLVSALLLSGCFLKKKKNKSSKNRLIVENSVYMNRIGDGDRALLQFKTTKPLKCRLEIFNQDTSGTPTIKDPAKSDCVNSSTGKTEFSETIEGLRTDSLYFVHLYLSEPGADDKSVKPELIREEPNSDNIFGESGSVNFNAINVARLNVPLKAAEFHRYKPDRALTVKEVKDGLTMAEGCRMGVVPPKSIFSTSNTEFPIDNLATRDFMAGSATRHPHHPNRLQALYRSTNELMEKWTLIYSEGSFDRQVVARPVSRIVNLEMQSEQALAFGEPQLAESADPLKIDPTRPLKFTWATAGSLLENTYMTVQIGRGDDPKAIHCVFKAERRTGDVPADLLAKLDDKRHVVIVEMAANQIWINDSWIITTYDWRSSRIEK